MNIGPNSCVGLYACKDSDAMIVQNSSCVGDLSCSFTKGFAEIASFSCEGAHACTHLVSGAIGESSCVGVGSCSRPKASNEPLLPFTVGPNSCSGCYAVSSN